MNIDFSTMQGQRHSLATGQMQGLMKPLSTSCKIVYALFVDLLRGASSLISLSGLVEFDPLEDA